MTKHESSDAVRAKLGFIADKRHAITSHHELQDDATEVLMPLEAIAKAILVKANGLPAYWKSTGLGPQRKDS
jgi:hypothetical protein